MRFLLKDRKCSTTAFRNFCGDDYHPKKVIFTIAPDWKKIKRMNDYLKTSDQLVTLGPAAESKHNGATVCCYV